MSKQLTIERIKEMRAASSEPCDNSKPSTQCPRCQFQSSLKLMSFVDFLLEEIDRLRALGMDLVDDREALKTALRHKD